MSLRTPIVRSVYSCLRTRSPLHPLSRMQPRCFLSYTQGRPESNEIARNEKTREASAHSRDPGPVPIPKNWLSDVRKRIGKCITWGLTPAQLEKTGGIMKVIAEDWRDMVAGSQGFLTGRGRDGLSRQEVVWGEMDSMGHVNNVSYNHYAESARIKWANNYATYNDTKNQEQWRKLWSPSDVGLILKSIETQFKFPMTWPDRISVYHRLLSDPKKSGKEGQFSLKVLILSEKHQRASAECTEEIVVYDYNKGAKTHMAPFMLEAFIKTWEEQQKICAKKKNIARVEALLRQVTELEKEIWDDPNAKEDFGSAAKA